MSGFIRKTTMALGLMIALFGLGIDYLLPGTSPGLNLPQLAIIAVGIVLILVARPVARLVAQAGAGGHIGKPLAKALLITCLTLLVIELAMTAYGAPTYFPVTPPTMEDVSGATWLCDELGCHYEPERLGAACEDGKITGRICVVNRQGFTDSQDFVYSQDLDDAFRILMLGDSFTQGFTADIGHSFVETLEAAFPEAIVWNTAIAGRATNQAVLAQHQFAPILNPHLTILGFHMDDFRGNVTEPDGWLDAYYEDGRQVIVKRYARDRLGNPVDLDPQVIFAYQAHGYPPPLTEVERVVGLTRLGTLFLRLLDFIAHLRTDDSFSVHEQRTIHLLTQLRDAAKAQGSDLLMLIIPWHEDHSTPSQQYLASIDIARQLEIPYIDTLDIIDPATDYATPPDFHWGNAGHAKIGGILTDCVEAVMAGGALADCEHVNAP